MPPREAIYQACLLRFRPILMTTMAALLAALPLMLGTGTGSELRHPLGVAIVGGLHRQPGADAVHDAGDLSRLRPAGGAAAAARPGRAARGERRGMNLSAPFIARPVATTLLTIGIALAGIAAFFQLPVSPLPQVDFPTILVQATLPGASPETVATSVATPLERHLGQIADVTEMTSQSTLGQARIILQFGLDRDIDGAARDVQAAINAARADLPTSLRSNPTYRKVNPADAPILILALTSKTLTPGQLYDAAANVLQQRLSQIARHRPGHASAAARCRRCGSSSIRTRCSTTASGWRTCARRWPRPTPTARRARSRTASGAIRSTPTTRRREAADYRPLVIAYRNGAPVRLSDVAEVVDFGRGPAQRGPRQRQAGGAGDHLPPAGRQHHRDRRRG